MLLKMDSWHSEWVTEDKLNSVDHTHFHTSYNSIEDNKDSPNISRDDSIESFEDDQSEKNDTILKPTFKSVLQAKKRLQAFSATKQLKKSVSREDKTEECDKFDKTSIKKTKKALYPDDKAKAVIKEIEEIKRMEGHIKREELPVVPLPEVAPPVKSIHLKEVIRARSRSLSSEREHFKRREIKSRNYRRKSVSPEDSSRRKSPTKKLEYPKNWSEYKAQNLTLAKDDELKKKFFPKQKYTQQELINRIHSFEAPSPILEAFKSMTVEDKMEVVPTSFMRVTRAKPYIAFSINFKKNKEGFISRAQLFNIIPRDRQDIIEKFLNTSSRFQSSAKIMQDRRWYSKTWKRVSDAECKILENSVGLSFLQTYSDEDEDNETEEVVICSSARENGIKGNIPLEKSVPVTFEKDHSQIRKKSQKEKIGKLDVPVEKYEKSKSQIEKVEKSKSQDKVGKDGSQTKHEKIKQQIEQSPKGSPSKKVDISTVLHKNEEKEKFEDITPKKNSTELKKWQRDELNETRRAIKELEEELERRKALKMEEDAKEEKRAKKRKKRKKERQKQEVEDSEEEEEATKKKKKRKNKVKKKVQVEEDSLSSDDEKRKKKKNKKDKYKKEKVRKKKEKNKKEEVKETRSKKKDELIENEIVKDDAKKKKKKSNSDDLPLNDKNKSAEVSKKKKKSKKSDDSDDTTGDEVLEEKKKPSKEKVEDLDTSENSGKKKKKKNRWDDFDIENYDAESEKYEINKSSKLIDLDEIQLMNESKQVEVKEDNKKLQKPESASKEKTVKHEKELKYKEEEKRKCDKENLIKGEKETKRTKSEPEKVNDNVKVKKDIEETKLKDNEDIKSKKHDEYSDKKYTNKEKLKVEIDKNKKSYENIEDRDKRDVSSKVSRDRRSSEKSTKSDNHRKYDDSRDRHHDEKLEKRQKEKRSEERHDKLEHVRIKEEPDWENIRSKRKRHRDSDSKDSSKELLEDMQFPAELEDFPLEKEVFRKEKETDRSRNRKSREKKVVSEFGTPDTDDYRENWEKDPFPIWESEDDAPPPPREKLNNSWESDEETFERGHRAVESTRSFKESLDLEIPLNIKPFKRREIINPDIELQLLKRESITLSEERRRLEIEKQRVKELELKVIREVENKALEDKFKSKRRRSIDEKPSRTHEREKEGRWDKREVQPKKATKLNIIDLTEIKREKCDEDCTVVSVSSSTPTGNPVAVLENEYEEFIKAVTSTATPKRKVDQKKLKKIESVSSNSSISGFSDSESRSSENSHAKRTLKNDNHVDQKIVSKNSVGKSEEVKSPARQTMTILPKDIPLIPMPAPVEVKPVPVPSPQVDVDKIPKPLINLSLSANITLDIASKLTPRNVDSPNSKSAAEFIDSPVANFDIASKLGLPGISTPPSVKSLEFRNSPLSTPLTTQSSIVQKPEEKTPSIKTDPIVNFASPLTDASLDSVLFEEKATTKESQRLNKPFVFTSMVIQSKRLLLDNSNLNLDDSDDEAKNAAMTMKSLEEIRKENSGDNAKPVPEKDEKYAHSEKIKVVESSSSHVKEEKSTGPERKEAPRSRSPASKKRDSKRSSKEKAVVKKDVSPKRSSHGKRDTSPRRRPREPSPKRRRSSPRRHPSPKKRSPPRRRSSPAKRKYSPRRSTSPRHRRRSISPRRRSSPRRSKSPKMRASSPKRMRSRSPEKPKPMLPLYHPPEPPTTQNNRPPSPAAITSPLEGLKRSVADSTISDDLLPQPSMGLDDYTESPISRFYDRSAKQVDSPKRVPLDDRISQVLGLQKEEPKPIPTTFSNYNYQHTQYSQQFVQMPKQENTMVHVQKPVKAPVQQSKSNFVQVGNMVRIVPTEMIPTVPQVKAPPKNHLPPMPSGPPPEKAPVVPKVEKSHIVQVGNMLQIVPADLPVEPPPLPPEPKVEPEESKVEPEVSAVIQEKQSAEATMKQKIAERRAEREQRREEREKRRKEKEKRRKEKEKKRQIKLKQRTENMIKKALQLEVEGGAEEEDLFSNEKPTQWPPLPLVVSTVSKEVGKSILVRGGQSKNESLRDKRKVVQFADGVRPGEGTSPSGGEELSSPPPASKKLPKEKRYKKTKLLKKNQKKKVKVKIIKKRLEAEESDEEDNLPPPSPPPGSPPPHIFPPRIKSHAINNVHPYIANVVSIQANHTQQPYRPQLNLIMHHPPHHHGPPPPPGPPHHPHGPPPPPGPPHHHHGPPPPGPPHHHHGPPPPGPMHFHHGPPPPPGPPHHHVPPLPHGPPGHHGPPPPYHH